MRINSSTSDSGLFTPSKHESCKTQCEKICDETKIKCGNELLYATIILSVLSICLGILSTMFYSLYKKEKKMRSAPWQVKSEDIRLERTHQNVSDSTKLADNWVQLHDEKSQLISKRPKHYYTTTGEYKGMLVAVQKYKARRSSNGKKNFPSDLDPIFSINNNHVCKFYGAYQEENDFIILTEYCTRGSLQDLLNEPSDWDDVFKNSLIFDIIKGMLHLHQTVIGSHGNLKPSNCLIDSRFMVKITDFGIIGQQSKVKRIPKNGFKDKLWTAPELLEVAYPPLEGTKKGDVYSFAIIAQEILYQRGVFFRPEDSYSPEEILKKLINLDEKTKEPFRPTLKDDDDIIINEKWRKTLKKCWAENPEHRPEFKEIFKVAMSLQSSENTLIDSLIRRLQKYSDFLEEKVEEKTEQYRAEKERSDSLLYQMLPKSVANRLKHNTDVMPESFEQVTVYFSDIVGFSSICHQSQPMEVVQMLNDLYTMFDQIIDEFDVYKVETIGDAYMVVSGLPIRNGDNHAREIARMAIRLRDCVCNEFQIRHMQNKKLKLRVGINTGPVVAGIVGLKMPRYCLFGDTVNTAARMEQNGEESKIHISPHTKEVLDKFGTFNIIKRRKSVTLKGLGEWNTWWLIDEKKLTSTQSFDKVFDSPLKDTTPGNNDQQRLVRSFSQEVFIPKSITRLAEEAANGKMKRHSNAQPISRKVPNYSVPPARYRPSSLANLTKQRRYGSATIPLMLSSRNNLSKFDIEAPSRRNSLRRVSIVTPKA